MKVKKVFGGPFFYHISLKKGFVIEFGCLYFSSVSVTFDVSFTHSPYTKPSEFRRSPRRLFVDYVGCLRTISRLGRRGETLPSVSPSSFGLLPTLQPKSSPVSGRD